MEAVEIEASNGRRYVLVVAGSAQWDVRILPALTLVFKEDYVVYVDNIKSGQRRLAQER